ncbi:hypothetical protein ACLOJK_004693 [Asimina triloba]
MEDAGDGQQTTYRQAMAETERKGRDAGRERKKGKGETLEVRGKAVRARVDAADDGTATVLASIYREEFVKSPSI